MPGPEYIQRELHFVRAERFHALCNIVYFFNIIFTDHIPYRDLCRSFSLVSGIDQRLDIIKDLAGAVGYGSQRVIGNMHGKAGFFGDKFIQAPEQRPSACQDYTMLDQIRRSGRPVGLKPSGGIRTLDDAARYLAIADEMMGPQWVTAATFRFGASGLLDALEAAIQAARPSDR